MISLTKKRKKIFPKPGIFLNRFLATHGLSEYTILVIFSIITGTGSGLAAVAFHNLIEFLNALFFTSVPLWSRALPTIVIVIPALGMFIQYLMIHIAPKQAAQKGVLQVIKSVALERGHIPIKTTVFHFFAPAICMGTGGTVGPEGPAAQIGAGVSSGLGNLLGLPETRRRIFTAAGAGAAIAAVFNTPMGGVFFALEVILLNDFRTATLIAFLLASVFASTISRSFLGNDPVFTFGELELVSAKYYFFYLLMGILIGLISVAFLFFEEWMKNRFKRIYLRFPRWLGMVGVGLFLGALGFAFPELLGIGYKTINKILSGQLLPGFVLVLLLLKFMMVPAILHSGGFGGTFAPSLFMGACFGSLFSYSVNQLFQLSLHPTTFILIGMGAMLAGINSIPIAGILIIFEMTNNYHFILPLMLAVGSTTIVIQMIIKNSVYIRKLGQEGFRYNMGTESSILRSMQVKDVMTRDILMVSERASLPKLVQECLARPQQRIYIFNANHHINGVISTTNLNSLITDYHDLARMIIARDLADHDIVFVKETDNLEQVMKLFVNKRIEEFPVLSETRSGKVLGLIRQQDIIDAYNQAIVKLNLSRGLAEELKLIKQEQYHEVMPGFVTTEIAVPGQFIGKSLTELKIRNRFNVEVLMVDRAASALTHEPDAREKFIPNENYRFNVDDQLILFGKKDHVDAFRNFCRGN